MKTTLSQMTTLGSLCLLLAGTATAALAQDNGDHHGDQGGYSQRQYGQHQDGDYRHSDQYRHASLSERRRLDRLHAAYAHAASHGSQYHGGGQRQGARGQYQGDHGQYQGGSSHQNQGQYQGGGQHQGAHGQYQGNHQGDSGQYQGGQHQHDNN